jgi:hypothetical protein
MFGDLSMITFPLWFDFFLGIFCFLIITGALRHFTKDKIVSSINKLPIEKKEKFISSYSSVVKIYKLFLFLIPIGQFSSGGDSIGSDITWGSSFLASLHSVSMQP